MEIKMPKNRISLIDMYCNRSETILKSISN